jgi:hypothetical protein
MNKWLLTALLAAPAITAPSWGTSITAIYGSGNPAEGWTDTVVGDLQLALRAKDRVTGAAVNVDGTYSYATAPAPRGLWNYEFSINSDKGDGATSLAASPYDFYLTIDLDPSQAFNGVTVNPLTAWSDNAYGKNSTLSGAGNDGTFAAFGALNNIAQNSQNITFLGLPLDPNATYDYELFAVAKGAGANGSRVASVDMTVIVGAGGAAVPDAGASAILLGIGVAGLAGFRRINRS